MKETMVIWHLLYLPNSSPMLIELLNYGFFQRALLAGILMGILAPLIGIFFVARRQAFFADTLAHASLAGVAIGIVVGLESVWAAMVASLAAAVGMEWLRRKAHLSGDAALALVLSGSLAFAVLLLSMTNSWNTQVLSYLFGSVTTVTWPDLYSMAGVALLVGIILYRGRGVFLQPQMHVSQKYRELLLKDTKQSLSCSRHLLLRLVCAS